MQNNRPRCPHSSWLREECWVIRCTSASRLLLNRVVRKRHSTPTPSTPDILHKVAQGTTGRTWFLASCLSCQPQAAHMMAEGSSSEIRLPGWKSGPHHILFIVPWVCPWGSLRLTFFIHTMEIRNTRQQNEINIKMGSTGSGQSQRSTVVVQLLSCVQLFETPWTTACQASLPFTISWS